MGGGVSDPPPLKNMGGAKYVSPPPHDIFYNKLYIYILYLAYCLC